MLSNSSIHITRPHFLLFQGQVLPKSPPTNSPLLSAHTKVSGRFMNVTLSRPPTVSVMLTYSLTVSLGTSVGKVVSPWLLQSTVLLLQTHLSGQPEANEPKEATITKLPRSPVSRLMVATPHFYSVAFTAFPSQDTCVTVSHSNPVADMPLGGFCHFFRFFPSGGASSLLACPPPTAGNCRAGPPDELRRDRPETQPTNSNPISAKVFT